MGSSVQVSSPSLEEEVVKRAAADDDDSDVLVCASISTVALWGIDLALSPK